MKYKSIILGYSWIGILNQLIFQWFFIRLNAYIDSNTQDIVGLGIVFPVIPLTGWWGRYIPRKPWHKKLICLN